MPALYSLLKQLPWMLLAYLLILAPIGFFYLLIRIWEFRHRQRRSPLTRKIPRLPGHSLRERATDAKMDLIATAFMIFVFPAAVTSFAYWVQEPLPRFPPTEFQTIAYLATIVCVGYFSYQLWKLMNEVRRLNLGIDGEIYVGAALNRLMESGCRVFHDVTLSHGNVDHVVVSPSGVFAVETKMLGKRRDMANNATVVVDYEKNQLQFPDRTTKIPLDQPRRQAEMLAKLLSSAVGKKIEVEPMLALPGWLVKRKGSCDVTVLNPLNATNFFVHERQLHDRQTIQQIAHQLEQLTSDVEPAFGKSHEWSHGR